MLVVLGITGDLARVMTLRSLYRLEHRGPLNCPIVGVAVNHWSVEDLRDHARAAIEDGGEVIDKGVFSRFARRLSYVSGDVTDEATYTAIARAIGNAHTPFFYLELPPSHFGTVIGGLSKAGLTRTGRVVVEKPFGRDLASPRELAAQLNQFIHETQLYRIDHFLGKTGIAELLYLRFANAIFEPTWNRNYVESVLTMAETVGVERRGHFYDPVGALRDVVVNHLMQVDGVPAMEPPGSGDADALKDALFSVFRAMPEADPARYVRGQYDGYRSIGGVAGDSTTETYAALRLEIDTWRWSGVPWFIRTGKCLPITQTELRMVFRRPPRLGFTSWKRTPDPSQIIVRLYPSTGIRMLLEAKDPEALEPEQISLAMAYARQGGEGLRGPAARGAGRGQKAVHASGLPRTVLAGDATYAERPAASTPLREGILGTAGGREGTRWQRPLAPAVGGLVTGKEARCSRT